MKTKGQAALEFMTTYGWAFMVILVMIGALASFGVLDPSKYLPQRCQFGEVNCENFALDSNGTAGTGANVQTGTSVVFFQILNGMSDSLTVSGIHWRDSNNPSWTECTFANYTSKDGSSGGTIVAGSANSQIISRDEMGDLICTSDDADDKMMFEEGKREKIEIRFTYNVGSVVEPQYSKYLYGEISANAR